MSNPEPKKGCGCCLAKGCLVLAVIALLIVAAGIFTYRYEAGQFRQFTAGTPAVIPVETVGPEEYGALTKRMDAFKASAPGSGATLTLSEHDFNVLIAMNPDWKQVSGKIHVLINDGAVKMNGSIPLSVLPMLRDQYLNGTLTFTPTMEGRTLHVAINAIKLKDQDISKDSVKQASAGMEPQLTNRLLGDAVVGTVLIKAGSLQAAGDHFVLTRAAD